MSRLRRFLKAVAVAALSWSIVAVAVGVGDAAEALPSVETSNGAFVPAYVLMALVMGLGLFLVFKGSNRRTDAKPEAYVPEAERRGKPADEE